MQAVRGPSPSHDQAVDSDDEPHSTFPLTPRKQVADDDEAPHSVGGHSTVPNTPREQEAGDSDATRSTEHNTPTEHDTPEAKSLEPQDLSVDAKPVVVAYHHDGQPRYLVHDGFHTTRQVQFTASYDPLKNVAICKLGLEVQLKGSSTVHTPVYLCIHPETVSSLTYRTTQSPVQLYRDYLGNHSTSLEFNLNKCPELIIPSQVFKGASQLARKKLAAMRQLAQLTAFEVHFQQGHFSGEHGQLLCSAMTNPEVKSAFTQYNLKCMYGGKGGKIWSLSGNLAPLPQPAPPPPYPSQCLEPPSGKDTPEKDMTGDVANPKRRKRTDSDLGTEEPQFSMRKVFEMRFAMMDKKIEWLQRCNDERYQKLDKSIDERFRKIGDSIDNQFCDLRKDFINREAGLVSATEFDVLKSNSITFLRDEAKEMKKSLKACIAGAWKPDVDLLLDSISDDKAYEIFKMD